ncbi:MAG: penicillin-insensitive murein endopeptidase, partial [Hyphomicrobiaceae bacterium]
MMQQRSLAVVAAAIATVMLMGSDSLRAATPTSAPPVPSRKPDGLERVDAAAYVDLTPARDLFRKVPGPAPGTSAAIGGYSRGCLSGAVQMPQDGPTWQAMRLSRNRHWGHPNTIALLKRFADEVAKHDGWPGLLVGDISMARGGPMNPAHASHQIGLDADIWFTPMPDRRLTAREREDLSATFMLTQDHMAVNESVWSDLRRDRIIRRVASYPEVERVLVHPAIKKRLCLTAGDDRGWLAKVRPVWGHNYHFHIRLACPAGSEGCVQQAPPDLTVDGCGAELAMWYKRLEDRLKPKPPAPRAPAGP